jgi:hypothetical protein
MSRAPVLLVLSALAFAAAPACAVAASGAVASTERYIQANYTLVKAGSAKLGAARAALVGVRHRIEGECANVAANSPQNPDSTQLSNEIIGAMVITAYRTDVPAGENFIRAAQGLRWSNHALTSAVQAYVGHLRVLNKLAPPNVCADVRAWVSSGYRTLPASTVRFDQEFMPNWVAIGELPSLLGPYERPSEKAVLRRTSQLEAQLTEFEAEDGVETWSQIMDALVLKP